jgi:hypothetical protein
MESPINATFGMQFLIYKMNQLFLIVIKEGRNFICINLLTSLYTKTTSCLGKNYKTSKKLFSVLESLTNAKNKKFKM